MSSASPQLTSPRRITRVACGWRRLLALLALLAWFIAPAAAWAHAEASPAPERAVAEETRTRPAHPVLEGLETDLSVKGIRFHYPAKFESMARPLIDEAPPIRDRILKDLSPEALGVVDIYLLPEIERYFSERGIVPRSPHWASGLALLREDVILIRLQPVGGGQLELDRTLGHELSHIALHHYTQDRHLPTWFIEGFAIYQTEEWTMKRAETLVEAGLAGSLRPLRELDRGFPAAGSAAQLAYAESAHFVFWLARHYGEDRLRSLLSNLHSGQGFDDAFAGAYPGSFDELEAQWREGLEIEGGWVWGVFSAGTAAMVLLLVLGFFGWRLRRRRREALAKLEASDAPQPHLPEHLKNFGPFKRALSGP